MGSHFADSRVRKEEREELRRAQGKDAREVCETSHKLILKGDRI